MRIQGKAAFVTGGGSGIGRELCLKLAQNFCRVTIRSCKKLMPASRAMLQVADWNHQNAERVVKEVESLGSEALAVTVDVSDNEAMARAFQQHLEAFKSLDIVCLNAGVMEKGDILSSPAAAAWEQTLDINLRAQIAGTLQAAHAMQKSNSKGVILYTASAGGIFSMPVSPVYAASKAGLIHFATSLSSRLAKRGIRLCTICPQAVDTPLVAAVGADVVQQHNTEAMPAKHANTILSPSQVAQYGIALITDDSKAGSVAFIHVTGRVYDFKVSKSSLQRMNLEPREGLPERPRLPPREAFISWATGSIPSSVQRVQVHRLSNDFRAATKIVTEKLPALQSGHVLVKRAYAGINASDVNFTSGRYFGSPEQSQKLLPFYAGFEAVGVVADVGKGVKGLKVGDCIAELAFGTFSEWGAVSEKLALPVPTCCPEMVALLTSGLTASIGLEVAGRMSTDEVVLVTAAAGGTGQFVVQLAKAAGNHVVATCGSREKAAFLKRLGADRVINYREEDVKAVLKKEYPKGINLIWESVGGQMFQTCTRALANGGRLVVIGMMSQYGSGWKPKDHTGLPELLLQKSASVHGFFLPQYSRLYKHHLKALATSWAEGNLQASLDGTEFMGVDQAADAVEYLQGGKSVGKVILQLNSCSVDRHRQRHMSKL